MKRVLVSMVVVCLTLSACAGQATPDPTEVARLVDQAVKATVAAMLTPEPVSGVGIGGPETSAQALAKAWVEMITASECSKAANYLSPDVRREIDLICGAAAVPCFLSSRIDEAVSRPTTMPTIHPGATDVTLLGLFEIADTGRSRSDTTNFCSDHRKGEHYGALRTLDQVVVIVEQLNGKWYVRQMRPKW